MPKTFKYQVFCLPLAYDAYYVQFEVNNPLPNASYSWDLGNGQNVAGIKFSREYQVGEFTVSLSRAINSISELIEATTIFVVGIPGKKLANGLRQLVGTVDLYTTTGIKQSISLPIKSLALGDAYAQNKSDYVNEFEETWSATTGFLSELQYSRLEATLQQLKGIYPFSFIPKIGENAVSVVCESWTVTQLSNCTFQILIEMKRYWEHSRTVLLDLPADKLITEARRFVARLYHNSPGSVVINPGSSAVINLFNNTFDPVLHPLVPSLPSLPPPPQPPFTGGQCCDVAYNVRTKTNYADGSPSSENTLRFPYTGTIIGAIDRQVSSTRVVIDLQWRKCDGTVLIENLGQDNIPRTFFISVIKATPAYAQSDNCGNPPSVFPPSSPAPPGGFNSDPTPITNDNGQNVNVVFNFNPSSVVSSADGTPQLTVTALTPEYSVPIVFKSDGTSSVGSSSPI